MASSPTCVSSGAITSAIGSLHSLVVVSAAGVYQLVVECQNMADGTSPDVTEFYVLGKCRPQDTAYNFYYSGQFVGAQAVPNKASIAVVSPHYFEGQLRQTAGSARSYAWALYQL